MVINSTVQRVHDLTGLGSNRTATTVLMTAVPQPQTRSTRCCKSHTGPPYKRRDQNPRNPIDRAIIKRHDLTGPGASHIPIAQVCLSSHLVSSSDLFLSKCCTQWHRTTVVGLSVTSHRVSFKTSIASAPLYPYLGSAPTLSLS